MGSRQQIQAIPSALRITLEKAHADFGAAVRKIRWGDGPIYVCGAGQSAALGLAAGYAFETFLGSPVVARPVEVFQITAQRLLRPRAVLLMMAAAGEWPEARELADLAHQRDCTVVALTNTSDSSVAKVADHVLLTRAEGDKESPAVTVCSHAALNFLALEAARKLKRPEPEWDLIAEEFGRLPDQMEWVFTQLSSVVRSMAAGLAQTARLGIVGGGFYHYPAWQAARRLESLYAHQVSAVEASEFLSAHTHFARRDDAVMLVSGSHSKIKKLLHRCAAQARTNGARVFCLTDSNDRDLADSSDVGVFIPSMLEAPASTLTLFMLEWLATEIPRAANQPPASR